MSTRHERSHNEEFVTEQSVVEYLRAHPEFFQQHPGVLAQIQIPHPCGSAVSLIEHQVSVLRDQNRQTKRKLNDLMEAGRENDQLAERVMQLTVALMEASSLEDLLARTREVLQTRFKADAVALILFDAEGQLGEHVQVRDRNDPALAVFPSVFKSNRPLCGRMTPSQLELLFGDQAATVGSAVLIGLGDHARCGLLAVGHADPQRFHPAMGTVFLTRIGTLIGCALRRYLPPATDG